VLGVLLAYPVAASGALREPLAALGILSALGLVVGLVGRWGPVVQVGLSLAVAQYAAYLLERGDADSLAPLYAAGLLVAAELAYDAIEPRGARERRGVLVALLGLAAALVAVLSLGAAAVSSGGLLVEIVGIAAAAATLALLARLAWNARER
jgi:hypothetical protein